MKRTVTLWVLLLLLLRTIAQNNLPPYEIKTDTGSYQNFDRSHWQMLEDSSGKLTIEDVNKLPFANRFHIYDSAKGIDFSIHTYWFRYILKNTMNHDVQNIYFGLYFLC